MFTCERCGSGYNGNYIGVESCPRCLLLDRVQAPLNFKMFGKTAGGAEPAGETEAPSLEETSRLQVRSAP